MARRKNNKMFFTNGGYLVKRNDRENSYYYYPPTRSDTRRLSITGNSDEDAYEKALGRIEEFTKIKENKTYTIPSIAREDLEKKIQQNQIRPSTYIRNLETIKLIKKYKISEKLIQDITQDDIDKFLPKIIHLSQSTITKIMIIVRGAFRTAFNKKYISENIMDNIKNPKSLKPKKRVRAFTVEEHKELIKILPNGEFFMQYMIGLNNGMRMGEINAIHTDNVFLDERRIRVCATVSENMKGQPIFTNLTKTDAGFRDAYINDILYPMLKKYMKGKSGYLFLKNNKPISTKIVTNELKALCKTSPKIKTVATSHVLRHTFATRCIEAGVPAVVLSKSLGHKDISTTLNIYTHVFQKFQNKSFEKATDYFKNIWGNFGENLGKNNLNYPELS